MCTCVKYFLIQILNFLLKTFWSRQVTHKHTDTRTLIEEGNAYGSMLRGGLIGLKVHTHTRTHSIFSDVAQTQHYLDQ